MNDPPGTIPPRQTHHPRRPPAHQSVSLRHSPPAAKVPSKAPTFYQPQPSSNSSPNVPASDKANPPSTSSKVQSNKNSSGESSDAGKWFESSNNNALQSNASFADNDPPFFLRNSSSSDTPPDGHYPHHASAIPYRSGLAPAGTDGSSAEEFRSVIDDLTIVNKKLKQRLKKYERLYDAHLQDEKLFEVRFHGLPEHKKKELKDTLRKFTADLDDTPSPPISYQPPAFDLQKSASSHTSRFAESGYASVSMSQSGQNSISAPSNQTSLQAYGQDDRRRMSKSQYNRQQQNVQSYLHDIPAGLLPKSHAPMTEKTKKRLVVRRLEQIFAGKRSAPGNHQQPMQQEEVAQSAAMADRRAKEATGQRFRSEGNREARIMPVRTEDEDIAGESAVDSLNKLRPNLYISEQDVAGAASPNQRPTRPLDLDPYRAQVPAENMEYIRHLGFTPPNMLSEDPPLDGHGWLYLNLLVNMAQLHTLNVTPDFVKGAVTEYSSKFELSHDGRKIRWRGGQDVTRNSGDSSSEHPSSNSPYDTIVGGKSPGKRSKTGLSGSGESLAGLDKTRRLARFQKEREQSKFTYTPIFFHKEESDEDEDFYGFDVGSSSNSLLQAQQAGDSSGFGSSAMRSSSSRRRRDDGPMIFYNKAKFCTDLTGDRHGVPSANPSTYNSMTTHPLGVAYAPPPEARFSGIAEPRGPLDAGPMDIDSKDGTRTMSSDEEVGFSPEALRTDTSNDSPDTMEFEASGLGGVQPDDNFAIKVRRSHSIQHAAENVRPCRKSQLYPKKIADALSKVKSPARPVIREEILSASHKSLPSSSLPPASFLPFDSTSSGDVDSDLESDVSSNPSTTDSSDEDPATAIRFTNISPAHPGQSSEPHRPEPVPEEDSCEEEGEEDEDDDSDDSDDSIDLLATARKVAPAMVRLSEREYDAALADRLAEEIPAGSSAATAGGGSGFNSPASQSAAPEDMEQSRRNSFKRQSTTSGSLSSRARNLKRARTREPVPTALQGSKSQKSQKLD